MPIQQLPAGNTLVVPVNQTCTPFQILPGQTLVVAGSTSSATAVVEFTTGTAADIDNLTATWQIWYYGTVTGTTPVAQGAGTPMVIRVTAQTASVTATVRPSTGDTTTFTTEGYSFWTSYPLAAVVTASGSVNAGTVTASAALSALSGSLVTLSDGVNIQTGATAGTTIATTTARKAGFHGSASAQAAAYTQTYSTASRTVPTQTSATLTDSTAGTPGATLTALTSGTVYATDVASLRNNLASLGAQVNALIADALINRQLLNALIDDLQGKGISG